MLSIQAGTQLLGQKFVLGEELGKGRTSSVRKCVRIADEREFAVKLHFSPDQADLNCLAQEYLIFRDVPQHKHLIRCEKYYEEGPIYEALKTK